MKVKLILVSILFFILYPFAFAHAVDRTLTWTDNSTNENGFIVQSCPGVCTNASTWTQLAQTAANVQTYRVLNIAAGSTTSYRVLAFNLGGVSTPSNIVTDVIPGLPAGATTVAVQPCSSITASADATGSVWTITCVP